MMAMLEGMIAGREKGRRLQRELAMMIGFGIGHILVEE
jgi:hypothetical protein